MSILEAMFFVISGIAVLGAIGTVLSKSVVYASLFLLMSLMAVAGIFVLIFVPFLALVQILIYGGAVIVVVLFALMLTRRGSPNQGLDNKQRPLAFVTGLAAAGVLIATVLANDWPEAVDPQPVAFKDLSETLFTKWAIPFEIASILLLIALVGAIVMAKPGDTK